MFAEVAQKCAKAIRFRPKLEHSAKHVLIAVIGHTGAGISTLINAMTDWDVNGDASSCSLDPQTKEIRSVPVKIPEVNPNEFPVYLVDTPGVINISWGILDKLLKQLNEWKTKHCEKNATFAGIIFVNSVVNPPLPPDFCFSKHEAILKQLCGKDWKERMVLVNTHWDEAQLSDDDANALENELADGLWRFAVDRNGGLPDTSKIQRFDNNNRKRSAWKVLWLMIENTGRVLEENLEMVIKAIDTNRNVLQDLYHAYQDLHMTDTRRPR